MNWFATQRHEWIVESVTIFGFINRAHIELKFGVSTAQSALDLKAVNAALTALMSYNASAKRYEVESVIIRRR